MLNISHRPLSIPAFLTPPKDHKYRKTAYTCLLAVLLLAHSTARPTRAHPNGLRGSPHSTTRDFQVWLAVNPPLTNPDNPTRHLLRLHAFAFSDVSLERRVYNYKPHSSSLAHPRFTSSLRADPRPSLAYPRDSLNAPSNPNYQLLT
ncbi:hypothetical protein K438DRAFT_1999193 [Mycena galopus ATCC 62051]|nr:hypothetical protein K438DRAFT_1999193 [Mycena galopus ATCC 62051]